MAEAKRIKATPVVQPPDTIQLTLTIKEATHLRAVLGEVTCGSPLESAYAVLSHTLSSEWVSFKDYYIHTDRAIQYKGNLK